jgi:hypothetical protein
MKKDSVQIYNPSACLWVKFDKKTGSILSCSKKRYKNIEEK